MKMIVVTRVGTYVDGMKVSEVGMSDFTAEELQHLKHILLIKTSRAFKTTYRIILHSSDNCKSFLNFFNPTLLLNESYNGYFQKCFAFSSVFLIHSPRLDKLATD